MKTPDELKNLSNWEGYNSTAIVLKAAKTNHI